MNNERGGGLLNKNDDVTPPTTDKEKKSKMKQKIDHLMGDTAVMRFVEDVKDGDLEKFDVTTMEGFWKELIVRIQKVDVMGLASQLAFFFLLSLFPLLIFIMTLLPFLNIDEAQIYLFLRDYAPESVAMLIESTLSEILQNRNGGLLSAGIIGTIWSASKGMNALTKALNRSYFKEETRSMVIVRGMSVVFTVLMITVVVVALILPVFGEQIGRVLFSYIGLENGFAIFWSRLRWLMPPILIFIVFSIIYWLVPNVKMRWKSTVPGSAFATVGWIVTSIGFSFYVNSFGGYSNTYGSIGAIIVLMMWLYFSAIILMLGGQINAVVRERRMLLKAKEKSNAVM